LALTIVLETALPQVRDPEYGYRMVRVCEQQRHRPDRPLVLAFGTSRTQNAIDPGAMGFPDGPGSPVVFNFGQAAARPVHALMTLRRLRADGVTPAAVLVELFPPALGAPDSDDPLAESASRLTVADVRQLEPYLADPVGLRVRWTAARLNSWYTHRLVVLSHLAPDWQPWQQRAVPQWAEMDRLGFRPYPIRAMSDGVRADKLARTRAAHEPNLRGDRVTESADRACRELIAECRAADIAVAFYFAPESPEFRSWYAPEWRAAVAEYARTVWEELGCPVFDAPTDFAERDFADGHHMLPPAAARYSRWLADRHLRPWLARVRP
jgi:hypothetical protein